MEVGIRQLKANLSEYLERVEAGEVITVTNRSRRIALILPLPGRDKLATGLRDGWIVRKQDRPPSPVVPHAPKPGTPSTTELIRQDRDA